MNIPLQITGEEDAQKTERVHLLNGRAIWGTNRLSDQANLRNDIKNTTFSRINRELESVGKGNDVIIFSLQVIVRLITNKVQKKKIISILND